MGVYIGCVDKPTSSDRCPFRNPESEECLCRTDSYWVCELSERSVPDWCPVELPDEEKYGEWLKYPGDVISDDDMWGETLYECSNCGWIKHVATKFCPMCGTKMELNGEIKVRWKEENNDTD